MSQDKSNQTDGVGQGIILWSGMLLGPILWLIQFQARYSLVPVVCSNGSNLLLQIIAAIALVCTVVTGIVCWRVWISAGAEWPSDLLAGSQGRKLFMAGLGMLTGGLFSLVMIAQMIPLFFFSPCDL